MKLVLFNNATAVPAADADVDYPSAVASGRIAAFNADDFAAGTLDLTTSVFGQQSGAIKKVVFVQGTGADAVQLPAIDVSKVRNVKNVVYAAPAAQVTDVTLATLTGSITLKVVRVDPGFRPNSTASVDVTVTGLTLAQIATAFVAALNAHRNKFFTAAVQDTTKIRITGDAGVSFQVAVDGVTPTITAITAPTAGTGTEAQLKSLEEQAWGANVTNRIYLPILPDRYASGNYDLFTFEAPTNTTAEISKSNQWMEVTLAVTTTATAIDLEAFFAPVVHEHA